MYGEERFNTTGLYRSDGKQIRFIDSTILMAKTWENSRGRLAYSRTNHEDVTNQCEYLIKSLGFIPKGYVIVNNKFDYDPDTALKVDNYRVAIPVKEFAKKTKNTDLDFQIEMLDLMTSGDYDFYNHKTRKLDIDENKDLCWIPEYNLEYDKMLYECLMVIKLQEDRESVLHEYNEVHDIYLGYKERKFLHPNKVDQEDLKKINLQCGCLLDRIKSLDEEITLHIERMKTFVICTSLFKIFIRDKERELIDRINTLISRLYDLEDKADEIFEFYNRPGIFWRESVYRYYKSIKRNISHESIQVKESKNHLRYIRKLIEWLDEI